MKTWGLFLLLPVLLQNPAPQPPGSVEGMVVEFGSGRPLSGVSILLRSIGVPSSLLLVGDTRADGTFVFRNVPAGNYQIEARQAGYIPGIHGEPTEEVMPVVHLVPSGRTLSGVRITLTPGGVIFGRLLDDRGEPVAGATVEALRVAYRDGEEQPVIAQTVVTNDLGDYRLFMLPPGDYTVRARIRSIAYPDSSTGKSGVTPVYVPGTIDQKEARRITLRPGEVVGGMDVLPFPTRLRRITGSVPGTNGDPAAVLLSPRNDKQSMQQLVDTEGMFELNGVVPGSYFLVARTAESVSFLSLDVGNVDLLNISIALGGVFEVPTRVRIEGHPPGDDPALENLYFGIHRDSPIAGLEPQTYAPFPNGRFTLNVLPGDYRIHLSRPDDFYIQSMTLGGVNVMSQGLRVEGSSETPLEIIVGSNPGSVEGRAEAGSVTVVLIPNTERRGQRDLYKAVKAGAGGEFRFAKVPPGDYKLFAWRAENGGPWRDPGYIGRYEDRGVPARVGKDEKVRLSQPVSVLDQ